MTSRPPRLDRISVRDLMTAARTDDLNLALIPLQDKAGIDSGDVAGVFFSGSKGDNWRRFHFMERLTVLMQYLDYETNFDY